MIVGIDLGTSTSEIAILRNGKPELLRDIGGSTHGFLPSVVAIGADGAFHIGDPGLPLLAIRPSDAVAEVKRLMGSSERVTLAGESWSPPEVSALILRHLVNEASRITGAEITEAIVTVPAYFTAVQRQATQDAGELAGLKVRRLINEPTAAALAYGIERPGTEEKVVVFDLGGGTLDVTVLELSEGVLDVMASTGNPRLGGKDFDERLMAFLAATCRKATGVDLLAAPKRRARLKAAAKRAKEELSASDRTIVALDNIGSGANDESIDWEFVLTRVAFEAQIEDLVSSTTQQLDEALGQKQLRPEDITTILMVGGSSRIPLIRQHVSHYFGGRPLRTEIHPDEAVALGAAVLAGIESKEVDPTRLVVTDVAPWTLGVAVLRTVDGEKSAGHFSPLIEKQSTIPRTVTRKYSTNHDWQSSVLVEVYQGDAPHCSENVKVGEFELQDLERAPAGAPIEISFSYNLSGELEVKARALGKERRVTMRPSGERLSQAEKAEGRARIQRRVGDRHQVSNDNQTGTEQKARQSPLFPSVEPLMRKAERLLLALKGAPRTRLEVILLEARAALIAEDQRALHAAEEALTNLLFEHE